MARHYSFPGDSGLLLPFLPACATSFVTKIACLQNHGSVTENKWHVLHLGRDPEASTSIGEGAGKDGLLSASGSGADRI